MQCTLCTSTIKPKNKKEWKSQIPEPLRHVTDNKKWTKEDPPETLLISRYCRFHKQTARKEGSKETTKISIRTNKA